jgi:hypothetical protein
MTTASYQKGRLSRSLPSEPLQQGTARPTGRRPIEAGLRIFAPPPRWTLISSSSEWFVPG